MRRLLISGFKRKNCGCGGESRNIYFRAFLKVVAFVFVLSIGVMLGTNVAVAAGGQGEGGGSSSTDADCSSNALDYPCPPGVKSSNYNWSVDGVYGGGASWRLFSVASGAYGLDDYTGWAGGILNESKKSDALTTCAKVGWIVSYGWDGMTSRIGGYSNYSFQIGPASRVKEIDGMDVDQAIKRADYNSYGALSSQDLVDYGFKNNARISRGAAINLYKIYLVDNGASQEYANSIVDVPPKVGYFCSRDVSKKSFLGKAAVSEGGWTNSKNRDTTDWSKKNGESVSISMKSSDSGVTAKYFLLLKTQEGSGTTDYWTGDGAKWSSEKSVSPVSDDKGTNVLTKEVTLKPGASHCRFLKFKPSGSTTTATSTLGACATAEVTKFYGNISVSGAVSDNTGYGSDNTTKNVSVNCASSGCNITFTHGIKTDKNLGSTKYHVERTSNLDSKVKSGTVVGNTTLTATLDGVTKTGSSGTLTLLPGMKVCEKIIFNKDNNSTKETGDATRELCVHATGNARDTNDETYLNIKVRNNDVDAYKNYQKEVYAKPGDKVEFQSSYNPSLQYTYNLIPDYMKINGGAEKDNRSSKNKLGDFFNKNKGDLSDWNNGFGINSENFTSSKFSVGYAWSVGDTTLRNTEPSNIYTVRSGDAGSVPKEKAETNVDVSSGKIVKTTPSQVSFSYNNNKFISDVKTGSVKSEAGAKVPYNFRTGVEVELTGDTSVKLDSENEIPAFSAGGVGGLKVDVEIQPKGNSKTTNSEDEKYATKSSSKLRLVVFAPNNVNNLPGADTQYGSFDSSLCDKYRGLSVDGKCYEITSGNVVEESFNENGITVEQAKELSEKGMTGIKQTSNNLTSFNVPDFDAGTRVCVAAAVYPSTSGVDENLDPNGDGKWNVSTPKCFVVYKKPSLQVWGGNVFSAGELNTPVASKNNVAGFDDQGYGYDVKEKGKVAMFGSFGELSLISVGKVNGFSSGAATGFGSNNGNGSLTPSVKGDLSGRQSPFGGYTGDDSSFCERSRLTFANTDDLDELNCKFSAPGLSDSGGSSANNDMTSLVSTFLSMDEDEAANKGVVVKQTSGDYKVSQDEINNQDEYNLYIEKGRTMVIYAKNGDAAGNVVLDKNIVYEDGYASLRDVPKMIIYAGSIKINCGVERVDAVLIAENDVDTCADSTDINSSANSRQLVINGTVIAGKLKANRTYGVATGSNSIVPAEIINYDTTLYLWGAKKADITETGKLDTSYMRELAPRR